MTPNILKINGLKKVKMLKKKVEKMFGNVR